MTGEHVAVVLDTDVVLDGAHNNAAQKTGTADQHANCRQISSAKRREIGADQAGVGVGDGGGHAANQTFPRLVGTDSWGRRVRRVGYDRTIQFTGLPDHVLPTALTYASIAHPKIVTSEQQRLQLDPVTGSNPPSNNRVLIKVALSVISGLAG